MTRTHADIIDAAGGASALARTIGVNPNTAKPWRRLSSIPAAYWASVAQHGIASLEELAAAAALSRASKAEARSEAA